MTLSATLLVVSSRFLLNYTYLGEWLQQAWLIGQQRISAFKQAANAPQVAAGTPPTITNANQSVVMLSGDQSLGSGVILTSDGLVLTNSHVVRNGGNQWTVQLADERTLPAQVVAVGSRDAGIHYDLALVQIQGANNLPVALFSDHLPQAGEAVWAIGAPYGKSEVITQGEVKKVTTDGILLSNTEVHPGNSGGPLLNQNGEVIGINTEINLNQPNDSSTASISVPILEQYLPQLLNEN